MRGFGPREVVGLVVLAVALVIGFQFIDPSASESRGPDANSATKVKAPTGGWWVQFVELTDSGELAGGEGAQPQLDFTFAHAPFPDFGDDRWLLRASAEIELAAGFNQLDIEHQGEVRVLIDGQEVLQEAGTGKEQTATVKFNHFPGKARIMVEARDTGGPFAVRFVD